MRRIELKNLVPDGTVGDRARSDVLRELTIAAPDAVDAPATEGAGSREVAASTVASVLEGPNRDVTEQISRLTSQLTTLNATQQNQVGATQDNTAALAQNTSVKSGPSIGSTVGGIATDLLGGSLSPIISGLISLFGGSTDQAAIRAPFPFNLPPPVHYDIGLSGSSPNEVVPVSYTAGDQPRAQMVSSPAQITVQVNAMDSQSFLDHSDEIARAVKEALLNSNALSDVISDL